MAIHSLKNEHSIFVEFQGLGVALRVVDEKLELVGQNEDDTVESELNHFIGMIRRWIKSHAQDSERVKMLTPIMEGILSTVSEFDPRRPQMVEALSLSKKLLAKADRQEIEAEALIIDILDLMQTYHVKVIPEGEDEASRDFSEKMEAVLAKMRQSK